MASILVVVAGHWLMAVVVWRDGRVEGGNALTLMPGLWLATWLLQVMPCSSSSVAWPTWSRRARAARLLRPTVVFLAVWAVAGTAVGLAGVPGTVLRPLALLVVQPLWFLDVYLLVVALAPAMLRLHRRFGPAVVVWLGLAAAAADLTGRLPGERVSNMSPPSLCIVALTVWLVGLAMLVRPTVTHRLRRPAPGRRP